MFRPKKSIIVDIHVTHFLYLQYSIMSICAFLVLAKQREKKRVCLTSLASCRGCDVHLFSRLRTAFIIAPSLLGGPWCQSPIPCPPSGSYLWFLSRVRFYESRSPPIFIGFCSFHTLSTPFETEDMKEKCNSTGIRPPELLSTRTLESPV